MATRGKTKRIPLQKMIWCKVRYWQSLHDISNEELEYREKVTVEYLGQYTEDAEPSDSSQSAPEESNLNHAETPSEPDGSGSDDPRYAILFISSLLAIGGIALLWRMKRTGKSSL